MVFRALIVSVMLVGLLPSVARADGLIVPFYGVNFGGDSGQSISSAFDASRSSWGVSFGWMGAGVIGVEGDFGYSPDFFGKTDIGGSSALTVTGNVLIGLPFGGQKGFGIRPYGLIGVGIVRSDIDDFEDLVGFDDTDGVWDVGGGVMIFFSSHVGLRGEVRYFRTFSAIDLLGIDALDSENLDFARGSVGLILRF
jgi:opacity protein-like surface antigen